MAVGTGIIGVTTRFHGFITDDAIEHTDLEVQSVADRSAESNICLTDSKVTGTGRQSRLRAKGVCIRTGPEVNTIARSPFFFAQGLFNAQLDDIEVKAVRLAGPTELVIRQAGIARAEVPLGRRVDIATQGSGR